MDESSDGTVPEKISELDNIFEGLLIDAKDLIEDLLSGVSMHFVLGACSIVFAVQTLWYTRHYVAMGDWVPLILSGIMMASGAIIIIRGLQLRKKYSRLSEAYNKLSGY